LDAEKAKYLEKVAPLRQKELNQAANLAERRRQLQVAQLNHAQVVHALAIAEQKSPADPKVKAEVQALQKKKTAAEQDFLAKEKLAAAPSGETYAPLGPQFPQKSSGRRTGLARWIASKDNPLTARVAVNYLWSWHFGRPIVETTFDLGRNGKAPTHPELLDWLAIEFMEQGWKMKPLHRLLVTSQAYRMRSGIGNSDNPNLAHDPDNRFCWRYPTQRLEAEMVRDCVLYLAGDLDTTRGGPDIPHEQGLTSKRRSIYFTHHGEGRMQFLELFDAANACECYQRNSSVMPQQALALSNSELTIRNSRILARKLAQEVGMEGSEESFIRAAFQQVLARPPSSQEMKVADAFLARQIQLFHDSGLKARPSPPRTKGGPGGVNTPPDGPAGDPSLRALENLVHALFNHNDFVTIR
jgi:hypothetical protein